MKPKNDTDYFVLTFGIKRPLELPTKRGWSLTPTQAALSLLAAAAVLTGAVIALLLHFRP